MIAELADSAIKLFGDDDTHKRMRQRRRAERPALLCALEDGWRQAIGAADHERQILALHAPARELRGEFFAAPGFAAPVERDDVSRLRNRGEYRRAFVGDRALYLAASRLCGYFHKLQWQVMRQALGVFGEPFADPRRHALTDGDQMGAHGWRD